MAKATLLICLSLSLIWSTLAVVSNGIMYDICDTLNVLILFIFNRLDLLETQEMNQIL